VGPAGSVERGHRSTQSRRTRVAALAPPGRPRGNGGARDV